MAENSEVQLNETSKKKAFRWSSEMVQNLITCLKAYKARMEYQAIDFDGDRPAQYKELRKEMAKLYEIEDVTLFGPVSLLLPTVPLEHMIEEDKKQFLLKQKKESCQIQKGHQRIQEKVKDIRQNFSKAVTAGTRSGSGKIVYEFYDELAGIWGGYPSTEPLTFGIDSESLTNEQPASENANQLPSQPFDNLPSLASYSQDNCLETEIDPDKESTNIMKRKAQNQVPKLIDNKRKHLEKTLSAAQRDKMLLDEAKEDSKFRKDLSDNMGRSTESFSNAMDGINSTLKELGKSISQSVEMLSQAILSQQQKQSYVQQQPGGGNHNIFYQNQGMYQPMRMPQPALLPSDETQNGSGMQQSLTRLTPTMQSHYPRSNSNEQQRFY